MYIHTQLHTHIAPRVLLLKGFSAKNRSHCTTTQVVMTQLPRKYTYTHTNTYTHTTAYTHGTKSLVIKGAHSKEQVAPHHNRSSDDKVGPYQHRPVPYICVENKFYNDYKRAENTSFINDKC